MSDLFVGREDPYQQTVELTKILAIAIGKLGGRLEIPRDALLDDLQFVISTTDNFYADTMTIKIREVRRELGEVLDVNQLEPAEYEEVATLGYGTVRKVWIARANDQVATLTTEDLDAEFYVSPILTMRTIGVALVDSSGSMVTHSVRSR